MNTRVLILAPTARDAGVTARALGTMSLNCVTCRDVRTLLREAEAGVGTILLTDESFVDESMGALLRFIIEQPSWSDLPVVLLLRDAPQAAPSSDIVRLLGNVTLLERPAPIRSVASAVQVAVRSRVRQYQLRDQFEQLRAADAEKRELLSRENAARQESERASRLKDEFLATLSHELRTPLNAILGWSQVLTRSKATGESLQEGLTAIERNARAQAELIADLLDMSRIISGKVRIETKPIDPAAVIRAALDAVRPSAEAKGVKLHIALDADATPFVADPNRLQQVVWNLLSNAIKFTPRDGQVSVRLKRVEGAVEIEVTDTGQGIEAEFLPHVFERFRQADASTTRSHGGLGLGLAIVKQLVEMHGGTISAQSGGRNRGAAFLVRLPAQSAALATAPAAPPPEDSPGEPALDPGALGGLRILVIDDDHDARNLEYRLLRQHSADVVTAASAEEGLQKLEYFAPDVILCDIGMPHRDGYSFLTSVRSRGIQTPAIAVTAFAQSDDRHRCLSAGFQGYVSKPVEPDELVAVIANTAERARGNP